MLIVPSKVGRRYTARSVRTSVRRRTSAVALAEAGGHRFPLPVPQDVQLEGFAPIVAPQDAHEVGRAGRLPAVDRLDHVAALEAQGAVLGGADDQDPVGGAEVLAQIGVEGRQLEVAEGEPARNSKRSPGPMSMKSPAGIRTSSSGPSPRKRMTNGRPPAGPAMTMSGSSSVTSETVRRSLPRRNSTATVSDGLEPGGELDETKPRQRLPRVPVAGRGTAAQAPTFRPAW